MRFDAYFTFLTFRGRRYDNHNAILMSHIETENTAEYLDL